MSAGLKPNIEKTKITYIEYTDKGKLEEKDIQIPTDVVFYNFDSQFTILEKLGNIIWW